MHQGRFATTRRLLVGFGGVLLILGLGCGGETAPPPPADAAATLTPITTRPPGTVADRLEKAEGLAKSGDLAGAIAALDEAMLIDAKDRRALYLLARYSREHARAVAEKNPGEAYRLIVSSGGYLRRLRDAFPEATDEEKTLGLDVLYDEATAHAKSKRVEETTGALRDAIGAGFRDFDRLEKDKDWDEMRAIPQFQKVYDEIKASAQPK